MQLFSLINYSFIAIDRLERDVQGKGRRGNSKDCDGNHSNGQGIKISPRFAFAGCNFCYFQLPTLFPWHHQQTVEAPDVTLLKVSSASGISYDLRIYISEYVYNVT